MTQDELKCPCCGGIIANINNIKCCCECNFECDNKDLPRIAAAMELVKRHKDFDNYKGVNPNIITDLVNAITVAEHNVLEVFK